MYRIVKMTGKYYAKEIGDDLDDQEEIDDIKEFLSSCEPVLLVDDIEDLKTFVNFNEDEDELIMAGN